jgi:DUF917 family protein
MVVKAVGKVLTERDIVDMIRGATILGTGGGGDPKKGLELLRKDLQLDRKITMVDPAEIPDGATVVCSYLTGSIAPVSAEKKKAFDTSPKLEQHLCSSATRALAAHIQKDIFAILPVEIGGQNTAEAIHVATEMGIPVVDGDLVGRAVPDNQQTSYYILGLPMPPIAVSDSYGDVVIITKVMSDVQAEMIVRAISVVTGGFVGTCDHPLDGEVVKKSIIPRTLTQCMNVGNAVREAIEKKESPLLKLLEVANGYLLFQGVVDDFDWKDETGFMYGTTTVRGTGKFKGTLRIWFKNENIIAWLNNEPITLSPDLICVVDRETCKGITNTEMSKGLDVAVIGIRAAELLRTKKGIDVLGPRHYGFDMEFVPIEKLAAGTESV